jgi:hypothetical protein
MKDLHLRFSMRYKKLRKSQRADVMRSQRERIMRVINTHAALYGLAQSTRCGANPLYGLARATRGGANKLYGLALATRGGCKYRVSGVD